VPTAAAAAEADAGCSASGGDVCSYVASLVRNATAEQLQCVLTWSSEDWLNYWRVRLLLESSQFDQLLLHVCILLWRVSLAL
jgi:hypothetical protein